MFIRKPLKEDDDEEEEKKAKTKMWREYLKQKKIILNAINVYLYEKKLMDGCCVLHVLSFVLLI